jgi:hypothetical protein
VRIGGEDYGDHCGGGVVGTLTDLDVVEAAAGARLVMHERAEMGVAGGGERPGSRVVARRCIARLSCGVVAAGPGDGVAIALQVGVVPTQACLVSGVGDDVNESTRPARCSTYTGWPGGRGAVGDDPSGVRGVAGTVPTTVELKPQDSPKVMRPKRTWVPRRSVAGSVRYIVQTALSDVGP